MPFNVYLLTVYLFADDIKVLRKKSVVHLTSMYILQEDLRYYVTLCSSQLLLKLVARI